MKMKDREKLGAPFVFLSDPDGKAAAHYAGHYPNSKVLNPATFVIGRDRRIVYAYVDPADYRVRAGADAVLRAVQAVHQDLQRKR